MPSDPITLADLAHGRSGDKGNHANVAVIAYNQAGYNWLRGYLTAERVRQYFAALGPSRVERFEVPNVLALNFVLYDVLAGGASRSLPAARSWGNSPAARQGGVAGKNPLRSVQGE